MKISSVCIKLLVAAIVCLLPVLATAIPQIMSYQGKLNDRDGKPVNGSVTMTFSMYSSVGSPGGTALWSETKSVSVASGAFNAELGTGTPLPDSMFRHNNLYLGIKVGADSEMTPRQRVTSGAFSLQAKKALDVPIGTIMAWAKNVSNGLALAEGWVECNGQTLNDSQSPLNGIALPNLNLSNRFLYGNSTSGNVKQEDYLPSHAHQIRTETYGTSTCNWGLDASYLVSGQSFNWSYATSSSCGNNGEGVGFIANQSKGTAWNAYSVVWIMKVR